MPVISDWDTPSPPYRPDGGSSVVETVAISKTLPTIENVDEPCTASKHPGFYTTKEDILDWLERYCVTTGTVTIDKEGEVSVDGGVIFNRFAEENLTHLQVRFKEVIDFHCQNCTKLESLEGSPQTVSGSFYAWACPRLQSLKGAPQTVGGTFNCSYGEFTSLAGGPLTVGGDFNCTFNPKLTNLIGGPKHVGGSFKCHNCTKLETLEGAPESVNYSFECSGCLALKSLQGAPQTVGGGFTCHECYKLSSLIGCPQTITGSFLCASTAIESLEGGPVFVGGDFRCNNVPQLKDISALPAYIGETLFFTKFPKPTPEQVATLMRNKTKVMASATTNGKWVAILKNYQTSGDLLNAIAQFEAYFKVPFPHTRPATVDHPSTQEIPTL